MLSAMKKTVVILIVLLSMVACQGGVLPNAAPADDQAENATAVAVAPMSIFVKTLTGKTVQLIVGDVQIGPRRQDGTFLIRVGTSEQYVVDAWITDGATIVHIGPER